MKKSILMFAFAVGLGLISNNLTAQAQTKDTAKSTATAPPPAASQPATGDIATVLTSNTDYSTLALTAKSAGVESTLKGPGPYTLFAPNNEAFSKLSKGKLDSLMKDPTKLSSTLKGHVVAGKYTKDDIIKALTAGKGKATLKTIDGQSLTLSVFEQKNLQVTDGQGNSALVTNFDLMATNGVVHGLNGLLLK